MTNVTSLASRKASPSAANTAITPTPEQGSIERQQAIENALSMALYHVRQPHSTTALQAATGRANRALTLLKNACAEGSAS